MNTTGLKFKTIAVATDLSETASSALRYAQAVARQEAGTLVVIHVIDPVGYAFPEGAPAFIDANQAAREELQRIEEETRRHGIPIHSVIETGMVYERILQAIKDYRVDLLVLGTKAKTEAGRAALGTVVRQLLGKAPCPILAVPPDADSSLACAGSWRNVLAAVDFSAASISALLCAHQMAHKQLTALHVARCRSEHECSRCMERLRLLAPFNEFRTVPVEHIVKSGDANELIADYARIAHADLLVLGAPGKVLSDEDFSSSTVLQVISKVTCPVLCVPAGREAARSEFIREVAFAG
ncbi:Universal stress protein family [Acidisarcina polymorpha]|uniref:Universal stress protein family n=1 Tax=Acidisarcina polymorpha TaxID=2211140 RepID=A0A2Z5G5V7_9BACT|nr:universal stress protein [Acidisarcina polymorpha]AXC14478.1 Universal stress protein family [Acidisarcina polymorpha]